MLKCLYVVVDIHDCYQGYQDVLLFKVFENDKFM